VEARPVELMYCEEPRPWTVEARPVELMYCEEPRPWTVESRPVELMYCEEPRPLTVEVRLSLFTKPNAFIVPETLIEPSTSRV
jgi:hypothetical protein